MSEMRVNWGLDTVDTYDTVNNSDDISNIIHMQQPLLLQVSSFHFQIQWEVGGKEKERLLYL